MKGIYENESRLVLEIAAADFSTEQDDWEFYNGSDHIKASMADGDFIAGMKCRLVKFRAKDCLLVDLTSTQTVGDAGMSMVHVITKVHEKFNLKDME